MTPIDSKDIINLLNIASTATIQVGQAREVAALLDRVEGGLQQAALAEAMQRQAAQVPVDVQVPAGIAPPA